MAVRKGTDGALHCVHVFVHTHVLVSPNPQHDAVQQAASNLGL